jgi:copper chaperone CopZ
VTGVKVDPVRHTATVTFDNTETNVETMKRTLAEEGYEVEGEPQFLD